VFRIDTATQTGTGCGNRKKKLYLNFGDLIPNPEEGRGEKDGLGDIPDRIVPDLFSERLEYQGEYGERIRVTSLSNHLQSKGKITPL